MGTPLFTIEDAFIDETCFGFNDGDTHQIFSDALDDGLTVMRNTLAARLNSSPEWEPISGSIGIGWDRDGIVVTYPEQLSEMIEGLEYGRPDVEMQPVLRQSISQTARSMAKTIEDGIKV